MSRLDLRTWLRNHSEKCGIFLASVFARPSNRAALTGECYEQLRNLRKGKQAYRLFSV